MVLAGIISTVIVFLSTAPLFWPFAKFTAAMRFLGFASLTYIFTLLTKSGDDLKIGLLTFGMKVFMTTGLTAEVKAIQQSIIAVRWTCTAGVFLMNWFCAASWM